MPNPEDSLFPDFPQNTNIPGVVIGEIVHDPALGKSLQWAPSKVYIMDGPREATGPELRDQGMSAAEKAACEAWKERVRVNISLLATMGEDFTAETVREIVGDPPDHGNAMGSLFHSAARKGIIERAGWTTADRPGSHARALAVWRGTNG